MIEKKKYVRKTKKTKVFKNVKYNQTKEDWLTKGELKRGFNQKVNDVQG